MKEVKATEKPLPKRLTNGSQDKAQSYEVPHGRAEGTDIGSNRASLCASKKPSQWGGGGYIQRNCGAGLKPSYSKWEQSCHEGHLP